MTIDAIGPQYDIFRTLLDSKPPADAIKDLQTLGVPDETIDAIRAYHESALRFIKELEEPRTVVNAGRGGWYTGPRKDDKFWPAVERILRVQGWTHEALDALDTSSTRIVGLLNHPHEKTFQSRGLVVGHVQSGKTSSYTSVIAKAADRGYKLVIVLSGIHNGLRRQTQIRLQSQLVDPNPTSWHQLTTPDRDFIPTANPAGFFGATSGNRILCVVKKNATVLRKLTSWLGRASQYLADTPTLIIDDEADQATVATRTINPLIRGLMASLPRSVYVGYTATPFANLLIDPSADDLYPQDFVVSLPKPAGHFGTEVIFGRDVVDGEDPEDVWDGYDMVRRVPDDDVQGVRPMRRADVPTFSPTIVDSLRDSVTYFLLATAARRVRGTGTPHSTMLIHTSVNTSVHLSFRAPLARLVGDIRSGLSDSGVVACLRELWDGETARVVAADFGETKVSFDDLFPELPSVIDTCRIVMDNSSSDDRLDYENGPVTAIAVGGNTLSRGLTLEGLSVSYFVRAVSAYDTLLQMGRWFGFRTGYADLPRIWMTDDLREWFRHLALVEHEMRRDIDRYMEEDLTPRQFAVRIRTHPALLVTARAKMRDAVQASASYGGLRLQTHYFHTNADWLGDNILAARNLIGTAAARSVKKDVTPTSHVFREVPYSAVLEFLTEYRFHEDWLDATTGLLTDYIQRRIQTAGSLRRWNVAVIGNAVTADNTFQFSEGVSIGRVVRSKLKPDRPNRLDYADIKTLMSPVDAAIDLSGEFNRRVESNVISERMKQMPRTGLVALYAIDKDSPPAKRQTTTRASLDAEDHVIGVGFVFPKSEGQDTTAHGYIQADLTGIEIEEEEDIEEIIEGADE